MQAFSEIIITRTPPGGSASDTELLYDQTDEQVVRTPGETASSELLADVPVTGEGDFSGHSFTEASDLRDLKSSALAQADTDPQELSSPDAGASYTVSTLSDLRVREDLTIHAPDDMPGLSGQPGTTEFEFDVDGILNTEIVAPPGASWDGDVQSGWTLTGINFSLSEAIDLGGSFGDLRLSSEGDRTDAEQVLGFPDASLGTYVASVPFTYGEEFTVQFRLATEADVRLDGGDGVGMLADAPFAGTATLLPLAEFTAQTSDGQTLELSGLEVNASSGTDYTAPIPEPGTAALLGFGLLGATAVRRSRRG